MEIFFSNQIKDGVILLDAEESAHCVRVLRHRAGDRLSIIDGCGTMYRCTLENADAKGAAARIEEAVPGFGGHPYHLTMAVCPTKNMERYEWFAEKATEIGLDVLAPVIGERSERKILKTERLERIVKSAAKQSLKGAIPEIRQAVSVRDFILSVPEDAIKMICYCFDGDKHSIPELLSPQGYSAPENFASLIPPTPTGAGPSRSHGHGRPWFSGAEYPCGDKAIPELYVLIGPEGDFSPGEAELALGRGWVPVTLGNSRLRTETAALVTVTQVYTCIE